MASCITLNDYRLAHKPKQWKCCHPKTHDPNCFAKHLYLSQTSKKEILLICSTTSYPQSAVRAALVLFACRAT